jgi:hypothetical protein
LLYFGRAVATELFAATARLSSSAVAAAIPPACRRPIEPLPAPHREGEDLLVDLPSWQPRLDARHLVPAFGALTPTPYSVRFELAVQTPQGWSGWVGTASLGPVEFGAIASADEAVESSIDLWQLKRPVQAVRLRVRLRADDRDALLQAPWLVTLSAWDGGPSAGAPVGPAVALPVPALSQLAEGGELGPRVCSPTSVAMVLGYWNAAESVRRLAAEMFHPALDLFGVWPAAIRAAARRGILGYLLRFPDWTSAAWCLARGVPIVASVRYAAGELQGAAIAATPGHLLVLTGYEGDVVLVNDPAANDAATVPRRYRLADLTRIWLARTGVGYVLFSAKGAFESEGASRAG